MCRRRFPGTEESGCLSVTFCCANLKEERHLQDLRFCVGVKNGARISWTAASCVMSRSCAQHLHAPARPLAVFLDWSGVLLLGVRAWHGGNVYGANGPLQRVSVWIASCQKWHGRSPFGHWCVSILGKGSPPLVGLPRLQRRVLLVSLGVVPHREVLHHVPSCSARIPSHCLPCPIGMVP